MAIYAVLRRASSTILPLARATSFASPLASRSTPNTVIFFQNLPQLSHQSLEKC
ncbi:unnamed protein product [Lupinus luteus]|uniref:Uncharacterized protein n=1 Tax=Lupinus luteus TaxID=3873 RepID=A0AAV1XC28_LUPLU